MRLELPALTFSNAHVLHGGALHIGALAQAGGLLQPGGPQVDLGGFAIMPGAIDLGGEIASQGGEGTRSELAALVECAVRAGTTTLFVDVPWTEGGTAAARAMLDDLHATAAATGIDLRARVALRAGDFGAGRSLLEALEDIGPVAVALVDVSSARSKSAVEHGGLGALTRHVSDMATRFEQRALRYGSDGDADGETREWLSMIGARMLFRPGARRAAASARAMGEPIVLSASDILTGGTVRRGLAAALLGEGMCDALASFGAPDAPLRAVQGMVRAGRMPLGHAWALISAAPAGIMRLQDRGGLVDGTRADLAILDVETLDVAGTIAAGQLLYANAALLERLGPVFDAERLAAE